MTDTQKELQGLFSLSMERRALKKAVCSKPLNSTELKTVLTPRQIGGRVVLQAERFLTDNKAVHENLSAESLDTSETLAEIIASHGQINLMTTVGDCEFRRSKKGDNAVLLGGDKLRRLV